MSDLILFEKESAAVMFKKEEGIQPLLDSIAAEVEKFDPDISSEKGRKEIKSMAYKVAQTKTAIDKFGSDLVADQKRAIKIVDTERKRSKDFLDDLKAKVRKPLTDWELAQQERLDHYNELIQALQVGADLTVAYPMETVENVARDIQGIKVDSTWQEFELKGAKLKDEAMRNVSAVMAQKKKDAADAIELENLRKEKAEKEQKEREERIAKEAAENATLEAESKAAKEKAESERLAQIKADQEKEKIQAAADKEKKELEQKLAYEKKKQALKEQDEREAKRRDEARAADLEHRKKINNEIMMSLMKLGADEILSKAIVVGLVTGVVPNVEVKY